jgi:predicted TPR repeat methyltransferase
MASLGYRGPEKLVALLDSLGPGARRTIDLGCGSGAGAALLRPRSHLLVGVDLSVKMIEKARERGLYDELVAGDMVDCLFARRSAFDLAFAADCLIYLGDLEPFLEAAAGALLPGGLLAATLETGTDAPYALQTSGRFAHSPEALVESAARWFELRALQPTFLRLEANRETHGALIVLQRRP